MACGVAVAGSATGEIPHVIGDAGIVFKENDVGGLRAVLERLIVNRALRFDLAAKGEKRAMEYFTWTAVAKKTREIYEEVLQGK
jgi:glycosyltransferase involved in cell wall biosynthesis